MPLVNRFGSVSEVEISVGVNINGIIEQYKVAAGENISVGDFVEFINELDYTTITSSESTQLSIMASSGQFIAQAALLNDNTLFVIHGYTNRLQGLIVEINDDEIVVATPSTQLTTVSNSGYYAAQMIPFRDNTFFIVHGGSSLYGLIVEINNGEITVATPSTLLSRLIYSGSRQAQAVLLNDNTIFIIHSGGSYSYGLVATITNNEITVSIESTELSYAGNAGNFVVQAVLLNDTSLFVICSSSSYLIGRIVTITDNKITVPATSTRLSSISSSGYYTAQAVLINSNTLFIIHGSSGNGSYMYSMIATVNGDELTVATPSTQLTTVVSSGYYISQIAFLNSKTFFITHSGGSSSNYSLYGLIVEINDVDITVAIPSTQLSTMNYSGYYTAQAVLFGNNNLLVVHSSSDYYLYGLVATASKSEIDVVKPYENTINGIAKTNGSSGNTIDVYVPN